MGQPIQAMVTKARAVARIEAEQAVHRLARQSLQAVLPLLIDSDGTGALANGIFQPRCRLSGRGGERYQRRTLPRSGRFGPPVAPGRGPPWSSSRCRARRRSPTASAGRPWPSPGAGRDRRRTARRGPVAADRYRPRARRRPLARAAPLPPASRPPTIGPDTRWSPPGAAADRPRRSGLLPSGGSTSVVPATAERRCPQACPCRRPLWREQWPGPRRHCRDEGPAPRRRPPGRRRRRRLRSIGLAAERRGCPTSRGCPRR